jgi:hypothetical protein
MMREDRRQGRICRVFEEFDVLGHCLVQRPALREGQQVVCDLLHERVRKPEELSGSTHRSSPVETIVST